MHDSERALFDRISQFTFDEGGEELTFAGRLTRENGWTTAYSRRVIDEYRRFVFLAMVAGHPVTPSDQVDQVWHLHLTYTRCYWDRFCGEVLGRPLHHGPTRGGSSEATKFDCWYRKTQESYRRIFGEDPPDDIWPDSSIRFGRDLHFQRTNLRRNWVIPKPRFAGASAMNFPLLVLIFAWGVWACSRLLQGQGSHPANDAVTTGGRFASTMVGGQTLPVTFAEIPTEGVIFLAVIATILGVYAYRAYVGHRCPHCKERHALKRTGATQRPEGAKRTQAEWQCKYCRNRIWKTLRPGGLGGSGSGAGCGGLTGCGCSGCSGGGCGGGGCGGDGCGGCGG